MTTEDQHAFLQLAKSQARVIDLFTRAELAKRTGDYARARGVYGTYVEESKGHLEAAVAFNARFPSSNLRQDIPPLAEALVNALTTYADLVEALGDRSAPEQLRAEALDISEAHLGPQARANTARALASSQVSQGRFNEALVALRKAREGVREGGDPLALARVTLDYANVLQWLGDFQRALDAVVETEGLIAPRLEEQEPTLQGVFASLFGEFQSILSGQGVQGTAVQAAELHRAAMEVTFYRGLISKGLGDWEEAERAFREVEPAYRQIGSGEAIDFQIATTHLKLGRVRKALHILDRLAPAFERGAFRPKRAALQRVQAECYEALGDVDRALRLAGESVADLTDEHFDPDLLWRSQGLQARLHAERGETAEAVAAYSDAVETVTSLRRAPLGYRLDSAFLDDKQELFAEAIAHAMRAGDYVGCCRLMDGVKSRTLTAILSIPASADPDGDALAEEFEAVTRQLDGLEYQAYDRGWDRQRRLEHRDLLQKRADLLESIRISDPRWRTLSEPVRVDYEGLPSALAERGQAVLSLYYSPPTLSVVLIAEGEVWGETVTIPEAMATSLGAYAANLQKAEPNVYGHDFSAEYGVRAEHLIPRPLLERAIRADTLVVVPHGVLHLVPWAGLMHEGRRLFENLPVGVLPNLAMLAVAAELPAPTHAVLIAVPEYGNAKLTPLPSARAEVEAVASTYQEAGARLSGPLLDGDATEAAFWELVRGTEGGANVLHVSCHGTIVSEEPMSGGLLLFDAKVDAAEVARSHLPFPEVVLSACSTGWRPVRVGGAELTADEVLGIPAGFLEAGAGAVLVSIPKAEGRSASRLTSHYHARRAAGEPPLRAFQQAQLHALAHGEEPPAAWLGFTLYGCS